MAVLAVLYYARVRRVSSAWVSSIAAYAWSRLSIIRHLNGFLLLQNYSSLVTLLFPRASAIIPRWMRERYPHVGCEEAAQGGLSNEEAKKRNARIIRDASAG